MVLLRRVIGDALRARRQGQHRTLREVSTEANVSLGYLSEIERGQKEASSELLAAICDALGARLSEVLREVGDTLALAEQVEGVLVPVEGDRVATPARRSAAAPAAAPAGSGVAAQGGVATQTAAHAVAEPRRPAADADVRQVATDGTVSVSVRQDTPLKATLRATRSVRRDRDVVCAA
jgi:transcriptional regulator with XRE-family HTH domain